jgi:hypothetical protein
LLLSEEETNIQLNIHPGKRMKKVLTGGSVFCRAVAGSDIAMTVAVFVLVIYK